MKKLKDLIKDGKNIIDAEKIFDSAGEVDSEYLEILEREKPILPRVSEGRAKLFSVKENRDRMVLFPDRLPTTGLMPLPLDEHELIGQFESKQNLYLLMAHAFNKAMERIESLEKQVVDLTNASDKPRIKP